MGLERPWLSREQAQQMTDSETFIRTCLPFCSFVFLFFGPLPLPSSLWELMVVETTQTMQWDFQQEKIVKISSYRTEL